MWHLWVDVEEMVMTCSTCGYSGPEYHDDPVDCVAVLKAEVNRLRRDAEQHERTANQRFQQVDALMAEAERWRVRHAIAQNAADLRREEIDDLKAEVERLTSWLLLIDGGDNPVQDEFELRKMAYRAVTLGHEPPQ